MRRFLHRLTHPGKSPAAISLYYMVVAGLWIFLSSYFVKLGIEDTSLLRLVETAKGLLFVAVTGSLLYLLLRTVYRQQTESAGPDTDISIKQQQSVIRKQAALFIILLLLVPLLGFVVVTYEKPHLEKKTFNNLHTVAELKARQIENWLHEHAKDARDLAADPVFIGQVMTMQAGNDAIGTKIHFHLEAFCKIHECDAITLFNPDGTLLLQSGEQAPVSAATRRALQSMGDDTRQYYTPVYRSTSGEMHIDFIVPLTSHTHRLIGAIAVHIHPENFLFPYIQQWPTDSPSGESMLIMRQDDSVVFINRLRHNDAAAMSVTHPLNNSNLPAAIALSEKRPGIVQGDDYRGVPVYAAYTPVANTDWMIIAKMDREEVIAPLYTLVRWISLISLISLFTIIVIGISLRMLWLQQRRMYDLEVESEKIKTDRALRHFYHLPFIGMAITSPVTRRWLQFNDHLCELFGYSRAELATKTWDKLTHPEDLIDDIAALEKLLRGEIEDYITDKRFIRKDGSILFATLDVKCVRKDNGEIDYFVTTIQDITHRKATEQALIENEAWMKALLSSIPDLVWLKDTRGMYLFCNPVFERFFGASQADIIGHSDYDFVDRKLANFFREHDRKAMLADGPSVNEEWLAFKEDGYRGLFETIKTPMYNAQGELIGVLSIARDITDRKQIEQRLDLVIKGSSDAPWDWDLVQDELYYSPQFWDMLGYEADELQTDSTLWRRLAHADDVDAVDQSLRRVTQEGLERDSVKCRFRHKDGYYIPCLIRGVVTRDEDGNPVRLTGTVMDLTERKRLEAERLESLQRMEKIADRLPGMVYQYHIDTGGIHSMPYASRAISDMFEVEPQDVSEDAGKALEKIVPEDKAGVEESIHVSARKLTLWQHEFRIRRNNGAIRWLSANAQPQKQDDGSVLWHGFVTDITERKSTEAKVRLAAKVFEQSREGIIITDADDNIIMVNRAFTSITGYSEAEALGQNPRILSSSRQKRDFYHKMWDTLDRYGYWQGEIWNKRKNGVIYPEWMSITRTFDDNGMISGHIGVFEDITQRKEYEEHIHWLAHFDPLTSLPNRALLIDRSNHAINLARRSNKKVSVLYCDLDRFKNINDALGHAVGDKLLSQVAERLLSIVRDEDTTSRQGGDEFMLVLPDTDANGAAHVAEKILTKINQPYSIHNYELTITFSIGIAVFPDDGNDFETLARHADIAMYRAKQLGRNSYLFFTPELREVTARTLKLENDIQNAIKKNELELYYQPQVTTEDSRIVGVEALIRWQHPEFGMVSPLEFIPIAEQSEQILRIGEWVIRTATQQLRDWIGRGIHPIKVAVNLSARQLKQPQLFEKLVATLNHSGLDPQLLELEITESMLMEDQENVITALNKISDYGIQIAIDDFGTGYSSLSYLKRFPVNYLKIDKSFIQDMLDDPDAAIIAGSIIALGHSLGLNVIAEGVETEAQLQFLRAHHCDHVQGYFFSKPLPEDEIRRLLETSAHLKPWHE